MKKTAIIVLVFSLSSCRSAFIEQIENKYFTNYPDVAFSDLKKDPAHYQIDSVKLDDTYALYIRQMCRKRPPNGYYDSLDPINVADVTRCNCEEFEYIEEAERLEIQYLFYSEAKSRTILITTIPPYVDKVALRRSPGLSAGINELYPHQREGRIRLPFGTKVMRMNSYDEPLFSHHTNYVNINYFNLFEFGHVKDNEIVLDPVDGDVPDRIRFQMTEDNNVLRYMSVRLSHYKPKDQQPSQVFANPVKFYRQKDWDIGLDNEPTLDSLDNEKFNNYLENKTIYMVTNKSDSTKMAIFYFQKPYVIRDGYAYHYSMFGDNRIKSYRSIRQR